MNIKKVIAKTHCYIGQNKPNYVVIHETDNWSHGADAEAHANAMKNGNLKGTVHYYVDSQQTYQTLEHQDGAWAVGDGHGQYGISNFNSINIEICVNPESNYYVAVDRASELAAMLLNQYGWDTSHLKRHYDASRKHCPRRILDEGLWDNFVRCTAAYMKKAGGSTAETKPAAPAASGQLYRVRTAWNKASSQIGAYRVLENARANCPEGYSVFDSTGKKVYTHKKAAAADGSFQVQVTSKYLRIRKAASINAAVLGYTGKGIFTITKTSGDWGYLKSGAGWINIKTDCVKRL